MSADRFCPKKTGDILIPFMNSYWSRTSEPAYLDLLSAADFLAIQCYPTKDHNYSEPVRSLVLHTNWYFIVLRFFSIFPGYSFLNFVIFLEKKFFLFKGLFFIQAGGFLFESINKNMNHV